MTAHFCRKSVGSLYACPRARLKTLGSRESREARCLPLTWADVPVVRAALPYHISALSTGLCTCIHTYYGARQCKHWLVPGPLACAHVDCGSNSQKKVSVNTLLSMCMMHTIHCQATSAFHMFTKSYPPNHPTHSLFVFIELVR